VKGRSSGSGTRSPDLSSSIQWILFHAGERTLALELSAVREIVPLPTIAPIPKAPQPLVGAIHLRGWIVPVLCTRTLLGFPPIPPHSAMRIVALEHGGHLMGLLVDEVITVGRSPLSVGGTQDGAIPEPPPLPFVAGSVELEAVPGRPVWLIDPDRLLEHIAQWVHGPLTGPHVHPAATSVGDRP